MASDSSVGAEANQVRDVALRWIDAIAGADLEALGRLVTDDIVVVHGNGRAVEGRDAVLADFARSFSSFDVRQTVEFEETIVAGEWAFDRATVHSTISPREAGAPKQFEARTMTILRRGPSQTWRVARSIGVIVQHQP